MPSKYYFDLPSYIDRVLRDCHLGEVTPNIRESLEEAIELRISDRILAIIVSNLQEGDQYLFKKILEDHPELDDIDALMLLGYNIPGIREKIEKALEDLYEELTYDAN